jgi:ribosomal protein L35
MTKKSISNRIKITGTGKLMRRPMGQGHFKAKKTGKQNRSKRGMVQLSGVDVKQFKKYL